MTYAPASLRDLGSFWAQHGGVNLGVVGNAAHTIGYHLGHDRIYDGAGPGIGDRDYSVQHKRDKAGLTNAASAIDLGRLNGSLEELYAFSRWLVAQCQAGKPGATDVREVIYSPDGRQVVRFSGVDGDIHSGPGNGDDSHRTHTHISYFRDAERRDKRALFAPYFEEADDAVAGLPITDIVSAPGTVTVKNTPGVLAIQVADLESFGAPPKGVYPTIGIGRIDGDHLGPDGAGGVADRHTVRLIAGKPGLELAVLLDDQVDFKAAIDPIQAELERASIRARDAVLAR